MKACGSLGKLQIGVDKESPNELLWSPVIAQKGKPGRDVDHTMAVPKGLYKRLKPLDTGTPLSEALASYRTQP